MQLTADNNYPNAVVDKQRVIFVVAVLASVLLTVFVTNSVAAEFDISCWGQDVEVLVGAVQSAHVSTEVTAKTIRMMPMQSSSVEFECKQCRTGQLWHAALV